jgi:NADH dehydrogenase
MPTVPVKNAPHHVLIIGGGFAGLYCAKRLGSQPHVRVTLVDRRNFHLFQPLLYQVATGALASSEIASPLRYTLKQHTNVQVLLGEVTGLNAATNTVQLADGELHYDSLVLATGSHHHYFGKEEWSEMAPGLKTLEDALTMRQRILAAFEAAEREEDAEKRKAWQTFVIVGAGPTGVELAGSIAELASKTMRQEFRSLNLADTRIIIAEGTGRVLPVFSEKLSACAAKALAKLKVEVQTETFVTDVTPASATLKHAKSGELTTIPTHTILWAAGVAASPLGKVLAENCGAELDRMGRVLVNEHLAVPSAPNVFVVGDLANFSHTPNQQPLPGVAPVAMQQGAHVAQVIVAKVEGTPLHPFVYTDKGSMAIIGNNKAIARVGKAEFDGFLAWLLWLMVHVAFLVEFDNRVVVTFNWLLNYLYKKRVNRLITGLQHPALLHYEQG